MEDVATYFEANGMQKKGRWTVPDQESSIVATPEKPNRKQAALINDVPMRYDDNQNETAFADGIAGSEIVICGFNRVGQLLASFIQQSEMTSREQGSKSKDVMRYVGFDLDPRVVVDNFRDGKRVLYGDGSRVWSWRQRGSLPRNYSSSHTKIRMWWCEASKDSSSLPNHHYFRSCHIQ